ncbi:MAG: hypothetical protein A3J65_01740 [Candidatus Buchananbacteria bacterium RIFCSPHIGHO2_02_FULL_45_11b]|uniref:Uncharacterized protein n=1 Tax=Candidatus Buchananbacteria bacterium RIFCSPHIGHO2_02_FULL_45_11b TaxID=1797541 RepID=A0A1G1YFP2_9BACT|nr:MAG: hypothetical protein A3J65_01740 [Candidatus Buchananbacteria bacterium RIFCSPHIGHO2_02_FULL_45_11b]
MSEKNESDLMLDVGLANEIKLAARRAGATSADLKRLAEGDMFARVLPVIREIAKVVIKHLIDLDADPFVPKGWKVVEHQKGGPLAWDPKRVALWLSENQNNGKAIEGRLLREELKDQPVFNANLLDYLLAHPELIPDEWKGKAVFFWGTIYRNTDGNPYVRYLHWRGESGRWDWTMTGVPMTGKVSTRRPSPQTART